MNIETLRDLFLSELRRVYAVEMQLVDALETLEGDVAVDALDDLRVTDARDALEDAFAEHREETRGQVERLEAVFEALDQAPETRSTPALDGLIHEKELFNNSVLNDEVRPLYYVDAGRQIEQHEIAAYDRLLRTAPYLDVPDAVIDNFEANREEEVQALRTLESVADGPAKELLEALAESASQS